MKLLEHRLALVLGNAIAGVGDIDPELGAAQPRADQHAAGARVAQRVGEDVLQDAPEQRAVRANRGTGRAEAQRQPLLLGQRQKVGAQRREQRLQ